MERSLLPLNETEKEENDEINNEIEEREKEKMNIAKDRKVIPDPIDDRKFQE